MREHRITHMNPTEAEAEMARLAAAWVPCGVVEWHSDHLPLGTDGLKTERLCDRFAQDLGGLVFPVYYLGSGLLQYPFGLATEWALLREVWEDMFRELERLGFEYVFVVSGHYSGEQLILLAEAAEAYMAYGTSHVLASREAGPLADSSLYFDHAALYETSLMMALEPSLVNLQRIDPLLSADAFLHPEGWRQFGVMGSDPRAANKELGLKMLDEIVSAWKRALGEMQLPTARDYLREFYGRQRMFLADVLPYYSQYFETGSHGYGSWDEAWDGYYQQLVESSELERRVQWFRTLWRRSPKGRVVRADPSGREPGL